MEPGHKHPQIMLTAAGKQVVSISPVGVPSGQGVIVNYITDPGNQPKTFGNHIYVWQTTENTVPWEKTPDGDQPIDTDSSASTQFVTFDFEDKGYIVGYATAPTPTAVCATIFIPAGTQNDPQTYKYDHVGISTVAVAPNLVQVKYSVLDLYTPAGSKNYVGLMLGGHASYSAALIKKVTIPTDASPGYVTIGGVKLLIGTTYTIGYFMNADATTTRTSLAASTTFTVGLAHGS